MKKIERALESLIKQVDRTDAQLAKTDAQVAETSAQLAKTQRAIGELGNKWGSYTEGLAAPSVERMLRKEFGAGRVLQHVAVSRDGLSQEYDFLGWVNGRKNEVILAEIKSNLTESELRKFEKKFEEFFDFFPEHPGKTLRGVLVAVDMPKEMPARVAKRGFYLMRGHDELFDLVPPPPGFKPRKLQR